MEARSSGCTSARTNFPWGLGLQESVMGIVDNILDSSYRLQTFQIECVQVIPLAGKGRWTKPRGQRACRFMGVTGDLDGSPMAARHWDVHQCAHVTLCRMGNY